MNDCRVVQCSALSAGGGVATYDNGSLSASSSFFEGNRTTFSASGGGAGGAITKSYGSSLTLTGCTFRGNTSFQAGAINLQLTGGPTVITACHFEDNTALEWSGAIQAFRGVSVLIDRCIFRNNRANALDPDGGYAGAIGNYGLISCGVACDVTVVNSVFEGNAAADSGGGINADEIARTRVYNCTFYGNTAAPGRGGGMSNTADFGGGSVLTVAGAIVRASTGGQILNNAAASVTYSNVEGGYAGMGNSAADPLFVGPGNYQLGAGSPALDAASNPAVPAGITLDLAGALRFVDYPGAAATGVPGGAGGAAVADMGAYERQCYPDCNRDGAMNLSDFGCFQTKFALGDPYADCNGDGARNLSDFGCFQTKFALGCP
ncbi:MAG: hypothetical protein IT437_03510 [Phycisphaerales bacterium]|nr:hypothetical protein [Phycisphaerales bacterium]